MSKKCTLLGRMSEVMYKYREGELITSENVNDVVSQIVEENVDKTFIESLSATSEAPLYTTFSDNSFFFFANGTPITIVEREDGEPGALIKWEGGEQLVDPQTNVLGGRHDDDTLTNGSITMLGGTVRNIIGGGLHKSHTVKTVVLVSGGNVIQGVQGGGASSLTKACGCENGTKWYDEEPAKSPCVVDSAEVIVTENAEIGYTIYGGGEGISYTKKAIVKLSGNAKTMYVTAGGSNGGTDVGEVQIMENAYAQYAQGINRGTMKSIRTTINGGTVDKLFVGGEVPFAGSKDKPNKNDASGKFENATLVIKGGTIKEFSYGGNDYEAITKESPIMENIIIVSNNPDIQ